MPASAAFSKKDHYKTVLSKLPYFSDLDSEVIEEFLRIMHAEHYSVDEDIFNKNDEADSAYVIIEGMVEVTELIDAEKKNLVAVLYSGDWIGIPGSWMQDKLSTLLPDKWQRSATVTAKMPTIVLRIDSKDYNYFVTRHPSFQQAIEQDKEQIFLYHFFKKINPFRSLTRLESDRLRLKIKKIHIPSNQVIISQGEKNNTCYFILSGIVEVSIKDASLGEAASHVLTTLQTNDLFGEISLMAHSVCNATIRALTECDLITLNPEDLEDILSANVAVAESMSFYLLQRGRAKACANVEVFERDSKEGQKFYVLKNTEKQNYFQLSPEGYFIWQHLDGSRSFRELTELYILTFKKLNFSFIAPLIFKLAQADFVEVSQMQMKKAESKTPMSRKMILSMKNRLVVNYSVKNANAGLKKMYDKGIYLLYKPIVQVFMLISAILGIFMFFKHASIHVSHTGSLWFYILCLFPLRFLSLVFHEGGHAFTTIYNKQAVNRAGFGWHLISPVVFIDTSNMWVCSRWQRIQVDIAGMYSEIVFAGFLMMAAYFFQHTVFYNICWICVFLIYMSVFFNLNPFIKLDGYYLLMDIFNTSNLRTKSVRWLMESLPKCRKQPRLLFKEIDVLVFWSCSVLYILASFLLSSWIAHKVIQPLFGITNQNAIYIKLFILLILLSASVLNGVAEIKAEQKKLRAAGI